MPQNPLRVGNWELKGILGQGGFGEVRHWINRTTNQEIATKHIKGTIKNQTSADQQRTLITRWQQELKWTLQFQMPFIVAGISLDDNAGEFVKYLKSHHIWDLPVIILEYCNGGDVRSLLQRPQNVNGLLEFEVREILGSLRQAVDFLHTTCRVCHRDLKPDNIVIHRLPNGRSLYKLTDFGLARASPENTIQQSVVGTRHYYAPEVVDTGKYKNTADYWSMGIIAYEVATGVLPFIPHQKAFNIHVNLQKKNRDCIAITENYLEPNSFHFHTEIPVGHHLSLPWLARFTKWLPLALDYEYSQRGALAATDEVQNGLPGPAIFTEIDRMLKIKVLTLFSACSYKRLEYEVTPSTTMKQLNSFIERETGYIWQTNYYVLPTGHPHKRLTKSTTPMDLYVEKWCDNSEESRNPPVMVYIFNITDKCTYRAQQPKMPNVIRHFITHSNYMKLEKWLKDHLISEMHHLLNTEHELVKMLLCGFKEYALTLEDEILELQPFAKAVELKKDMCCGAIQQFQLLLTDAQEQQKLYLPDSGEWQSNLMKVSKYKEVITFVEKVINHYESTLRGVRSVSIKESQEINDTILGSDIYKIKDFQRNYLNRVDVTCEELANISLKFAQARHAFIEDIKIKHFRDGTNQTHLRYAKLKDTLKNAHENLMAVQRQLLAHQLEMLPSANRKHEQPMYQLNNAMSRLSFDVGNGIHEPAASLDAFDSLSAENVIAKALSITQLLESEMDIDRD
ncbi:inhibitor of nuclear factor kappa-B kinase subunit beta [Drosophila montana]|uniref:inhibitor of nuclear factor kappa-B kinase subunit beta n=1 Tax=Drosophila montana TaxID=40370 RepID=UPI00313DDB2D